MKWLQRLYRPKMIIGVDAIMAVAGWVVISTVPDRMIAYEDCPIKKNNGILVAPAREFKAWLKANPEAAKEATRPAIEIIQIRKVKTRWRERIERRKIIF